MIEKYVKKLIENLPHSNKEQKIDLILDGGIFNGSYQIGCLYFLKEMENQNKIIIDKISGCSIGALCALLYHINRLDLSIEIYDNIIECFKKNKNLYIFHSYLDNKLKPLLPKNIHKQISHKITMSYYDVKNNKKIIKSKYKSVDEIINTIKRSSFVPFFVNGSPLYENKYIDGVNPYILKCEPNKKVLYIDLFGSDKLEYLFSVKNEKTNYHRILTGVLDIHLFFIKKNNTQMCSYVNNWSMYLWFKNRILKYLMERIAFYIIFFYIRFKNIIPEEFKETVLMKTLYKIGSELSCILVEHYCL
jgi:hypothetical protein